MCPSKKPFFLLSGLCLLALLGVGCVTSAGPKSFTLAGEGVTIKTILVLPFRDMTSELGVDRNVRCPLCGQVTLTGAIASDAPRVLSKQLKTRVERLPYAFLFSEDQPFLTTDSIKTSDMLERYVALGRQAGADAILVGHMFRHTERIGNRYSVQSPASVAFDLHLISTKEQRIVWTGYFDETQQSLSENLLKANAFFKRGATWLTADELTASGMDDLIERFPKP